MTIPQQTQIQTFLLHQFGPEQGRSLFTRQEQILHARIEATEHCSKSQRKTLVQTILPRIALYRAMTEGGCTQEEALARMRIYMLQIVGAEKHAATARMEAVPGFYFLYRRVFLHIMRTSDLWESTQSCGKDHFGVDIHRCLWHTACVEHGCPELCPLFCEVDNVTYGGLHKLGFARTKTLGCGGDCCDFRFFKQ